MPEFQRRFYSYQLGVQVFGVREMLAKYAQRLFKSIADIGIKNIELFDPATLKTYASIIRDLGMTPLATHFLPGYITGKWDTVKKIEMTPPANYSFKNIVDEIECYFVPKTADLKKISSIFRCICQTLFCEEVLLVIGRPKQALFARREDV